MRQKSLFRAKLLINTWRILVFHENSVVKVKCLMILFVHIGQVGDAVIEGVSIPMVTDPTGWCECDYSVHVEFLPAPSMEKFGYGVITPTVSNGPPGITHQQIIVLRIDYCVVSVSAVDDSGGVTVGDFGS